MMTALAVATLALLSPAQRPGEEVLLEIHRPLYQAASAAQKPDVRVLSRRVDSRGNNVGTYEVAAQSRDEAVALARQAQIDALSTQVASGQLSVQQDLRDLARAVSSVDSRSMDRLSSIETAMGRRLESLETKVTKLLEERDRFKVTVEVSASPAQLADELHRSFLSNYRAIVVATDESGQSGRDASRVGAALREALQERQTKVFDHAYCAADSNLAALLPQLNASPKEVGKRMGELLFANFVVFAGDVNTEFSSNTQGIICYRASCELEAVVASTGQLLLSEVVDAKGFGDSESKAKRSALEDLASKVKSLLFQKLEERLRNAPTTITFVAQSEAEAAAFRKAIAGDPKIQSINTQQNASGTFLSVRSNENSAPLLASLSKRIADAGFVVGNTPHP